MIWTILFWWAIIGFIIGEFLPEPKTLKEGLLKVFISGPIEWARFLFFYVWCVACLVKVLYEVKTIIKEQLKEGMSKEEIFKTIDDIVNDYYQEKEEKK